MEYRLLGKTGVKVSALCFGTMSFGGDADYQTSSEMFSRCLDAGINFFDCANVYGRGRSEEILGELMAGVRDDLVITSKVRMPMGDGVNDYGLSRRHIMMQVEASLKRLNTDRLDVYFVHHFDKDAAIEETLRALDDLVSQGKILYPGVSNWSAWQIAKALGVSAARGLARFEVIQPMYSLAKRQAEVEILPLALSEQMGVIPYSPLGGGLLTGKYTTNFPAGLRQAGRPGVVYQALCGRTVFPCGRGILGLCARKGLSPCHVGDCVGGVEPGRHGAHHRRTQRRAIERIAGRRRSCHGP